MSRQSWSETGWFLEAKGSRDLFATIGSIGGYSSQASIAWRGVSSSDYPLVSSLQRSHGIADEETLRLKERRIIEAAREWGLGYGPSGWSSDLQLLADLQHYGTKTRLIDVTSNPMTALWFACQSPVQPIDGPAVSSDGLLLAINTAGWMRYGRNMPAGTYSAIENPFTWELDSALDHESPFLVESLVPNDRLRSQEGFFVAGRVPRRENQSGPFKSFTMEFQPTTSAELRQRLGQRSVDGQTARKKLPFVAVLVPGRLKARVLQRLENSYNRRARVLFPDFSGFRDFSTEAEAREPINDEKSAR